MRQINKAMAEWTIARALSAVGQGIAYKLGKGGAYPHDALPTRTGECDCSGFWSWVHMLNRSPKASRPWWLETTAIYKDATGPQTTFVRLPEAIVGCTVVYPDRKVLGIRRQGHIGIVVTVVNGKATGIVDCSASIRSDAIRVRGTSVFTSNKATIYCALKEHLD